MWSSWMIRTIIKEFPPSTSLMFHQKRVVLHVWNRLLMMLTNSSAGHGNCITVSHCIALIAFDKWSLSPQMDCHFVQLKMRSNWPINEQRTLLVEWPCNAVVNDTGDRHRNISISDQSGESCSSVVLKCWTRNLVLWTTWFVRDGHPEWVGAASCAIRIDETLLRNSSVRLLIIEQTK